jgi:hypothetical protein
VLSSSGCQHVSDLRQISHLVAVPPFHVFTIPVQHAQPLRSGSPCYIMPRFEEKGFLDALARFQITQTIVVPPIMMALSSAVSSSDFCWWVMRHRWNATTAVHEIVVESQDRASVWNDRSWMGNHVARSRKRYDRKCRSPTTRR